MTYPMKPEDIDMDLSDMCINCVTPWKCNGPHIQPRDFRIIDPPTLYLADRIPYRDTWPSLDPDPLYVPEPTCCELAARDPGCACTGHESGGDLPETPTAIFLWLFGAVVVAAILLWVVLR